MSSENFEQKKILIMKTGNTIESFLKRGEDFEDWFIAVSGYDSNFFAVRSMHLYEELITLENLAGLIITGSPAYITDEAPWNLIGAEYIRKVHEAEIPILGVCYGHQLVAWAFKGEVAFNNRGREIGTVRIQKTTAANDDLLFSALPQSFNVQVSHQQSVVKIPDGALRLAGSDFEPNQAYRLGTKTWGIQFHPEFSVDIIRAYIKERREDIENEGLQPEALLEATAETLDSANLLNRFCAVALGN